MIRNPVDDWQELSALYEAADELVEPALSAWLADLERQGHPLLPELRRMLAARDAARDADFLGALPSLGEPGVDSGEVAEGARFGPYRLLRHLGRGGMAEVWLAQRDDGAFERKVAIKLLFRHAASHERDTFAQRFARERDILASLHHPNIAALHDAGVTPSGQPWLALEYVEGEPITTWCDHRKLGVEARVRIFRQVLLAVQHAHANLVIHRDLKPANILVTADGDVRLLDFGIAKLLEPEGGALAETELTREAGRPLTLQYASPEQLRGEPLTTACDVYSLGVVLYELLCGQRPYRLTTGSAAQLEQAILETEPVAMSRKELDGACAQQRGAQSRTLRKVLAGDLDAVVLKQLAKVPTDRYPSVEALRSDLEAWLAGRPVQATSPSSAVRVWKFVRRHASAVAFGTAATLGLVVLSITAAVMGLRAQAEGARAVASKNFLLDMFRSADPNNRKGEDITVREILEAGKERARTAFAGEPGQYAEVLAEIGRVQRRLGQYPSARDAFEKAAEVRRRIGSDREWAMAQVELADIVRSMGDVRRALTLLDAVRGVAARHPDDRTLQMALAEAYGWSLLQARDLQGAKQSLVQALAQAEAHAAVSPLRAVDMLLALADVESDLRDYEAAIRHIEQGAARLSGIPDAPPSDRVNIGLEKAKIQFAAGRYREASAQTAAVANQCDESLGKGAESCSFLRDMQAIIELRMGNVSKAHESVPRLLAIERDAESPMRKAEVLTTACRVLAAAGALTRDSPMRRKLEAIAALDDDMALSQAVRDNARFALAEAGLHEGRTAEARDWLKRIEAGNASREPLTMARLRMLEGIAAQVEGRHADALGAFGAAHSALVGAVGPEHTLTILYRLNQVESLRQTGRAGDARAIVQSSVTSLDESVGPESGVAMRARSLVDAPGVLRLRPGNIAGVEFFY